MINGVTRRVGDENNYWEAELGENGAAITLQLEKTESLSQIQLTFDPNLTKEIMPSMTRNVRERQVKGMPHELIKEYRVQLFKDGKEVYSKMVEDNYQRLNRICLETPVECDTLTVTVLKTHGIAEGRIYEVRAY